MDTSHFILRIFGQWKLFSLTSKIFLIFILSFWKALKKLLQRKVGAVGPHSQVVVQLVFLNPEHEDTEMNIYDAEQDIWAIWEITVISHF